MNAKVNVIFHSEAILEELSARQLFSGGIEGILAIESTDTATHQEYDTTADNADSLTSDLADSIRQEIVFIDTDVDNYQQLLNDILLQDSDTDRNIEVILLDNQRDGLEQITAALANYQNLDAVHLISHGSDGQVDIGNSSLNADTLNQNLSQISAWGDAFTEEGDLLIYGCNLAATENGQSLVQSLSNLTHTDVAASDDLTGQGSLGGDWDLEYRTGTIETTLALNETAQAEFQGVLNEYVVSNTADFGAGSLRQAIFDANANTGVTDTISFNIAGAGPHIIALGSVLPDITDAVIIDGTTEPDFSGTPNIVLDGNGLSGDGLVLTSGASGSTISGLVIRDFSGNAISIDAGSDNNTISGNYLGQFNADGTDAGVSENFGGAVVYIQGANNTIGGTTAADRNIISGGANGVYIDGASATGNQISGNYIGTDATGNVAVGNTYVGVQIVNGATNNTIGGATAAHGNVITGNNDGGIDIIGLTTDSNTIQNNSIGVSADGTTAIGNFGDGIFITGADNLSILNNHIAGTGGVIGIEIDGVSSGIVIQGNIIGTDATGTLNWGYQLNGIVIENGGFDNLVGGTGVGEGNIIAFSGQGGGATTFYAGVSVTNSAGNGNSILGNSIYSSFGLGIELGAVGIAANDGGDVDSGANNLQNYPTLTSSTTSGGDTTIIGSFKSNASTTYRIEFFSSATGDGSGNGEAETYLGFATVLTNGTGDGTINKVLTGIEVGSGYQVTATATVDLGGGNYGDTSEFALNITAQSSLFIVSNTNDSGAGSLRQAIIDANAQANSGQPDTIRFDIGADGSLQTIDLLLPLDAITEAVFIDGHSQYGALTPTTPLIELNGTSAPGDGIRLNSGSGGSTIQGLIINNFSDDGIDIASGSDNNIIVGNWIGLDNTGNAAASNGSNGVEVDSEGNTIGGTTDLERNVISGNNVGIRLQNSTAINNVIQGNYIGTNASGSAAIANTNALFIVGGASSNTIGGTAAGAGNVISGNSGDGFVIRGSGTSDNVIKGNIIGLDANGTSSLGNGGDGIHIMLGATNTIVGGSADADRNIISANSDDGIHIDDAGTDGNIIQGNYIGTDITGTVDLGNIRNGIRLTDNASNTTIGGSGAGEGNLISGNEDAGILLGTPTTAVSNVTIKGNLIGTDVTGALDLGNTQAGIRAEFGTDTNISIGGTEANAGNTIAYNGFSGVIVESPATGLSILGNSIFSNAGQGIDLDDNNNVAANDVSDADTGANNLQNFPVITDAITNASDKILISGTFNSTANTDFRLEFFSSVAADASGYGEAETYLGSFNVLTDDFGNATFSTTQLAAVASGEFITATATVDLGGGSYGGTSEFAANIVSTPNNAPIDIALGMTAASETQVNTVTSEGQVFSQVSSLADGGYVVVWEGGHSSDREIFAQRYDINGNTVGGEFQVNTATVNNQSRPAIIGTADGGFVITWNSYDADSSLGVYAQAYDSNSNTVGGEFQVNTATVDSQREPQIAAFDGGGYVVSWTSVNQDGSGEGIYAQQFDASHNKVGPETLINTHTTYDQGAPEIAVLADDSYVIIWDSWVQDGQFNGVYGQRFNSDGSSNAAEFRINTTTAGSQFLQDISALPNGGFVVTWYGAGEIIAQVFDADSNKLGGEIAVNTTTTNEQQNPSVTSLADGGFLIAWESDQQDGDLDGIFSQRFDASGNKIAGEFQLSDTSAGSQEYSQMTTLTDGRVVVVWESPDTQYDGIYSKVLSFYSVDENAANGTVIDTVTVTDPDVGDT
ncbi:MAG: DUF4347 domain-containing protein, partial [Methylophagaceae bacterium]